MRNDLWKFHKIALSIATLWNVVMRIIANCNDSCLKENWIMVFLAIDKKLQASQILPMKQEKLLFLSARQIFVKKLNIQSKFCSSVATLKLPEARHVNQKRNIVIFYSLFS